MTNLKHKTTQTASHTPEAQALAESVLEAAGDTLQLYKPEWQDRIIAACQRGIDKARVELLESLMELVDAESESPLHKRAMAIIQKTEGRAAWPTLKL